MTVGERIRIRREELGVSPSQLAQEIGHQDSNSVLRWENNKASPDFNSISSLADALQVSCDYIILGPEVVENRQKLLDAIDNDKNVREILHGWNTLTPSQHAKLYQYYQFLKQEYEIPITINQQPDQGWFTIEMPRKIDLWV